MRRGLMPPALICDSIHHIDLLRWLVGDTMETTGAITHVHAETYRSSPARERHNAVITFANGARAVLMSHFGVGTRIQRAGAARRGLLGLHGPHTHEPAGGGAPARDV